MRDCKQTRRGRVRFYTCGQPDEMGADGNVRAYLGSKEIGSLKWRRGSRKLIVENIKVNPGGQREGIGTAMYELVLQMACDYKLQMASGTERSVFGESFWKKQVNKKRARCAISNSDKSPNYWGGPLNDLEERIAIENPNEYGEPDYDRAAKEMKKLEVPKPRRGSEGFYWPCRQYVVKKGQCRQDGSLKGVRSKCRYGRYTRGPRKGLCRTRPRR